MANSTGYGPSRKQNGNKFGRLLFDGEETKYEIWETKFLGYLLRPVHKRKQIGSLKPLKTLHPATTGNDETFHSPNLP